jgi:hypothetical protein
MLALLLSIALIVESSVTGASTTGRYATFDNEHGLLLVIVLTL